MLTGPGKFDHRPFFLHPLCLLDGGHVWVRFWEFDSKPIIVKSRESPEGVKCHPSGRFAQSFSRIAKPSKETASSQSGLLSLSEEMKVDFLCQNMYSIGKF